jgi:hypothetical protein
MKKIALLVLLSFFGLQLNAQEEVSYKAKVESMDKIIKSRNTGIYEFQFPTSMNADEISKNAAYYTQYFTVDHDKSTGKVIIKMVENNERNRMVINRFFVSNRVREVVMEGTTYSFEKFYEDFLK